MGVAASLICCGRRGSRGGCASPMGRLLAAALDAKVGVKPGRRNAADAEGRGADESGVRPPDWLADYRADPLLIAPVRPPLYSYVRLQTGARGRPSGTEEGGGRPRGLTAVSGSCPPYHLLASRYRLRRLRDGHSSRHKASGAREDLVAERAARAAAVKDARDAASAARGRLRSSLSDDVGLALRYNCCENRVGGRGLRSSGGLEPCPAK
jgi:hypothetical protein